MSNHRTTKIVINVIREPEAMTNDPGELTSNLLIGEVSKRASVSDISDDIRKYITETIWCT